ncbi:hypothetical protein TRFO_26599 [Tritrichomonas foetus]|uniref:Uncharacterized protein n=1 Tax=Tritrichomonas foetus TaxID=1144522 RepID=A0A1J4K317_9EUKA|nr:hypothetical protein TRFO_26599 [Tritrichomonas foetus]|eukprot:OHT05595.1 hypothetical protein TRFO_26599 [Tritrichomonas foetus]
MAKLSKYDSYGNKYGCVKEEEEIITSSEEDTITENPPSDIKEPSQNEEQSSTGTDIDEEKSSTTLNFISTSDDGDVGITTPTISKDDPVETNISTSLSVISTSTSSSSQVIVDPILPSVTQSTFTIPESDLISPTIEFSVPEDVHKNQEAEFNTIIPDGKTIEFTDKGAQNIYFTPQGDSPNITFSSTSSSDDTILTGVNVEKNTAVNIMNPNIKVNMKGSGTVNLISENTSVVEFNIGNTRVDNQLLSIESKKPVNIEQLSLFRGSQFTTNRESDVNINTIKVQQSSTPKLSHCNIIESIVISLNASVTLEENVGISNTKVTIHYLNNVTNSNPVFIFGDKQTDRNPPNSITFTEGAQNTILADDVSEQDKEYRMVIISGISNCKDWKKAVNLDGSIFESSKCKKIENSELDQLVVSSKSSNGLGPGPIAGIVIACVVVVAVIVGVAVYVSKKKNQSLGIDSSISEDDSIAI